MAKLKLGKVQKAWVKSLKAHPERQMKCYLGVGTARKYKACCLGELLITECRLTGKKFPFKDDELKSKSGSKKTLNGDFERLGLRSSTGEINHSGVIKLNLYGCLASMNDDSGVSWKEIAKYIEKNPNNVFTKSV